MTMPLMTSTLPTIIGMGVVSKSTETLFGKNGRRRTTRSQYRSVGRRRVYTGKRGGKYVMKNRRRVYI